MTGRPGMIGKGAAMIEDSPVLRARAEPDSLRRRFALSRTEKEVWNGFRAGTEMDLLSRHRARHDGSLAAGAPVVRAVVIRAILFGELGAGRNARLALSGAHITGRLDLSYARIEHPIILRECTLDEPIVLTEARLGGLTLDGCTFPGIDAPNLELDGDLGLRHVSSSRMVNLSGGRFHRDIQLQGARLHDEAGALAADHVIVDGSVDCGDVFAAGAVRMVGAQVNGTLHLEGAEITVNGEQKVAFNGDGLTVGRDLNAQRLRTEGEVRLVDVSVSSTLELRGARLDNSNGVALRLDRAEISSSLYCDNGFTAIGQVCAIGAHVKGTLYLNNADLGTAAPAASTDSAARPDVALRLVRTRIDGDLGCWTGFVAHGTIDLARSSVAGEFTLRTTELKGYPVAANLTNARFTTLSITGVPPAGCLDLTKAKADFFKDGPAHWQGGDVILDEFEYTSIQMAAVTLKQREEWLRRALAASQRKPGGDHDGYLPQPYDQLADAYRRAGDDHAARCIQLAKYRQRNHVTKWRQWYSKLWNVLQDSIIGYGYAPLRALIWLIGLFVAGTVLFRYAAQPYSIAGPRHSFTLSESVSYTLNLLVPVTSLDDRQMWHSANGAGEVAAAAFVVFGWVLGATVFAGATRVLQRS